MTAEALKPEAKPHRMVVLVCGGRNYTKASHVYSTLDRLHEELNFTRLIEGAAPGADTWARIWAREREIDHKSYRAEWSRYGRSAGPIRNGVMLDKEVPDRVIAFPGDAGTADMVHQAKKAGIEVIYG